MAPVPYMVPDDVRARVPRLTVSDQAMADLIAEFEDMAERACGVAFTPREATESVSPGSRALCLTRPRVISIMSFGSASVDVADVEVVDGFEVRFTDGRWWSYGRLTVTYQHGYPTPPPAILRACALYVQRVTDNEASGTSRDVLAQTFDGGTTRYSTPDWSAGRFTGYLEVDRILAGFDERIPGIG